MKSGGNSSSHSLLATMGALVLFAAQAAAHAGEPSSVVYDANCALCHQKAGVGLAGQFPRLAGRVGEIAATEAGRRYLIEVALFGMAGKVDVDGTPIIGVMPPFAMLSDEDLAATVNYIIGLHGPGKSKGKNKAATVAAADIAKVRAGPQLTPGQVHANRATALPKNKK